MKKLDLVVEKFSKSRVVKKGQSFFGSRSGVRTVSLISFLESAFPVPILTDPFLVASILANKKNAFKLIVATTFWSVIGGVFAYFTAVFFFEWLLEVLSSGIVTELQSMIDSSTTNIFILTVVGAVTPVPYTLVAWSIAVLEGGLAMFIMASVFGRGLRYLVVGYSTYKFGLLAEKHTKSYLNWVATAMIVLVVFYLWHKM